MTTALMTETADFPTQTAKAGATNVMPLRVVGTDAITFKSVPGAHGVTYLDPEYDFIDLPSRVMDHSLAKAVRLDDDTLDPATAGAEDHSEVAGFVSGTMIDTVEGPVAIDQLRPGMRLRTWDNGDRPVRAVLRRTLPAHGAFAPIRIVAGALDNARDLIISPTHRVLVSDWRAQMLFGTEEVLVSACHLARGAFIHRMPAETVTYYHVLMDRHEIIFAEGTATESYHLSREVAAAADFTTDSEAASAAEISERNPALMNCASRAVRPIMYGYEAKALAAMMA